MVAFPVRHYRGNADTELWDDADRVITRNRELRKRIACGGEAWPPRWFFIGDPLSASAYAIDLCDPTSPVFWVDHCDLGTVEGQPGEPFDQWLDRWTKDSRADLQRVGDDPDTDPPPPVKLAPRWVRWSVGFGLKLFLIVGALIGLYGMYRFVRSLVRRFLILV